MPKNNNGAYRQEQQAKQQRHKEPQHRKSNPHAHHINQAKFFAPKSDVKIEPVVELAMLVAYI